MELALLPEGFSVCRLAPGTLPPIRVASLVCVTVTADETSIVCPVGEEPTDARIEGPFRAFKVAGPLDFALTGVLASLAVPLADERISIFAISTFDTDYILVRTTDVPSAISVLQAAGHRVDLDPVRSSPG